MKQQSKCRYKYNKILFLHL